MKSGDVPNRLPIRPEEPAGMDKYADDREALNDMAKYFNNSYLSDVNLIVGEETFPAHRLVLCKSSDVFERMLSHRWSGEKKDLEMVEESPCQQVFGAFIRFLYCNHVVLHSENVLPILILADKYNVVGLKKVCVDFAISEILPTINVNEIFSVWFTYATKAYHQVLIRACIEAIAREFEVLIADDWKENWAMLDRDQLTEILKCNSLVVTNEFKLWEAVVRWLQVAKHPERRGSTASPLLSTILPLISTRLNSASHEFTIRYVRFAFMTADELSQVERSSVAETHPKLFHPQILLAYKYQALPLESRTNLKEFQSTQFLLRNYTDIRWDRRISVRLEQVVENSNNNAFHLVTRSCTYPQQSWKWTLKMSLSSYQDDQIKLHLTSEDIDAPRSVEYMMSIVDDRKVLRAFSGKHNFTKSRYSTELTSDRKMSLSDLLEEEKPMLVNGMLQLQLSLRPID